MASRSVNKVILLGHLGGDAETRYTPQGVPVSNFTLATNRRWKDQQTGEWKEETDWHRVVIWRAENLAPHLQKGKQVYVEGRLQTRNWEDKDGNKRYTTEVIAEPASVILLGGRGEGVAAGAAGGEAEYGQGPAPGPRAMPGRVSNMPASAPPVEASSQEISDDDVPF
jgi:single-strand DNA-binding protein